MANLLNSPKDEVLNATLAELQRLQHQRAEVMKRIRLLKRTLSALAEMFGNQYISDDVLSLIGRRVRRRQPSLTKIYRLVLIEADRPLIGNEICADLERRVPRLLEGHKSPLASVSAILARLVYCGNAVRSQHETGLRCWKWVRSDSASTEAFPRVATQNADSHKSLEAMGPE